MKSKAPRASPVAKARKRPQKTGRREKNKEQTKRRILAAALQVFRDKGFDHATTREISKIAGIAEGTLFNYFKTKEDLALYFFQKETQDLIAWYRSDTKLQKAPIAEKLFAIIHRQLEYIQPYEDFIGAVFGRSLQPASSLSPLSLESQELRLKYLQFLREVLGESEEKGEIPRMGDLGAYAVGLFYMGIVTHWLHDASRGKQRTLALLDRVVSVGTHALKKGRWEW